MPPIDLDNIKRDFRINLAANGLKLEELTTGTSNKRFHGPGLQILDNRGRVIWSCSGLDPETILEEAIKITLQLVPQQNATAGNT